MQTSARGIALIKAHEGKRLVAYRCPADVWTIGYGHTSAAGNPTVKPGMRITEQEADTILRRDLFRFEERVNRLVKVPLTQGQFDALVSFDFNTGALHSSTLLKKLNANNYSAVPAQLMRWTRGGGKELPGLVRRRRDEAELWRSIDPGATGGRADVGRIDPPAPGKPATKSTTNMAAGAAAAVTTINAANEALNPVKEAADAGKGLADTVTSVMGTPAVLVAILVVLAAVWIVRERMKKSREEGV